MAENSGVIRRSDMYNDPGFNYAHFWRGRDYEHKAEVIAIRRLLNGRRFGHAVDVGGGFGRLSVVLASYADHVTLADPSSQQLDLSRRLFPGHLAMDRRLMDAANLQFGDESIDLIAMIRVLHHLPGPRAEFAELWRVLRPGGFAVIEAANSAHAVKQVRYLLRRERIPESEVDAMPEEGRRSGAAAYVNHHPRTISRQLTEAGFQIRRVLSVSNFRHPLVKAVLPERVLLAMERAAQQPLARLYFGPSTFFLVQKAQDATAPTCPFPGKELVSLAVTRR
jgi:ubiquinone/menaquinone biosynthesis C-methylase UbiE